AAFRGASPARVEVAEPGTAVTATADTTRPRTWRSPAGGTGGTPALPETPTRVEDAVTVDTALGEQRSLQIACYPDRCAGEQGPVETVLITVTDVTETVHARRELEQAYRRRCEETERLALRLHQVADAN